MKGESFEIMMLDHVAIRVKDLEESATWYSEVLGLKRIQPPEWRPFPIMMLAQKTGIALFPKSDSDDAKLSADHFAFHVTRTDFKKAKKKFELNHIDFKTEDHHYFDSMYLTDPDGYQVELTTLKVNPELFYK